MWNLVFKRWSSFSWLWVSTYEEINYRLNVSISNRWNDFSYFDFLVTEKLKLLLTSKYLQTISSWQVGRVIFSNMGLYYVVIRVFIKRLKAQSEYHDFWLNGEKRMCTIKASIIFPYSLSYRLRAVYISKDHCAATIRC